MSSSLADLSPPHYTITPNDHGAYVVIATWILACFMVLTVAVRVARPTIASQSTWGIDDLFILIAAALALIETGTVQLAVGDGLGKRQQLLSESSFQDYGKAIYSSQILFIAVLSITKISMILFIARLTPNKTTLRICRALVGFVAVWGAAMILALAFQCQLPRPWDFTPGRCFNQAALYYFAGSIDIATDLAISILPIFIVWSVQIKAKQRWTVIFVFVIRILVCLAEVGRLISFGAYFKSGDQTWEMVTPSIWTQLVMNISIITACVPCLKPFLASLQSGLLDSSMRKQFMNQGQGDSYALHSFNGNGSYQKAMYVGKNVNHRNTTIEGGQIERSDSTAKLTGDTIQRTREFTIDVQDRGSSLPNSSRGS